MKELKDRVAVVTGAASGIDKALAGAFSRKGMKLVLSDIDAQGLDEVAQQLSGDGTQVITCTTDVGDPNAVEKLAEPPTLSVESLILSATMWAYRPPAGPVRSGSVPMKTGSGRSMST